VADKEEVAVKVKLYIDEHYMETHHLNDYGKVAGYSKFYTARLFREAVGITIGEYLQYVRLEKLKELLLTTTRPFYSLVYDVGYASVGGTFLLFKTKVGCSPREYRKLVKC
jgi:AraC-like DNA-binding protein